MSERQAVPEVVNRATRNPGQSSSAKSLSSPPTDNLSIGHQTSFHRQVRRWQAFCIVFPHTNGEGNDMYKQIGLALCLCTMAMGLNSVLAADNVAKPKQDTGAYSVTISPTEWVDAAPVAEKKQRPGSRAAHAEIATAKVSDPCHDGSHANMCSHRRGTPP